MTTRQPPAQLLFFGTDAALLRAVQTALPDDNSYHLIATDEPAEAVVAVASFPFALLLLDVETDFETGLETIRAVIALPTAMLPPRLALLQTTPTSKQLLSLVQSGASGAVAHVGQHPERVLPFIRRYT